jgi:flavin reductase (DIM6/NTAB) family NADH-FMN oxidoreductase RutF
MSGASGDKWLVLGEVVAVHVDRALLTDVVSTTPPVPRPERRRTSELREIGPDAMLEMT